MLETIWPETAYSLLDFGQGRKLEQFGSITLDRPCPAAANAIRLLPAAWETAQIVIGSSGQIIRGEPPRVPWQIQFATLRFHLALTPFGHVGLFPEQAENWRWLADCVDSKNSSRTTTAETVAANLHAPRLSTSSPSALNLFGYTGAATLVLAAAGCNVVHVDASAPAVAWARRNAELNGLANAAIRWIVEDARKFVEREVRRGNRYDIVVLDPPSYGHGPSGKRWELERDLPGLLKQTSQLFAQKSAHFVVTCHTDRISGEMIDAWLRAGIRSSSVLDANSGRMTVTDLSGRELDMGMFLRGQIQL